MRKVLCLVLALCLCMVGCRASIGNLGNNDPENVVYLVTHEIRIEGSGAFSYEVHNEYVYNDDMEYAAWTRYVVFDGVEVKEEDKIVYTFTNQWDGNTKTRTGDYGEWVIVDTTVYDDNGNAISSYSTRDGAFHSESRYEYDDAGRVTYSYYKSVGQETQYWYTYDGSGKILTQTVLDADRGSTLQEYKYDGDQLTELVVKVGDKIQQRCVYEYDKEHIVKETNYDADGNVLETKVYEYDGDVMTGWTWLASEGTSMAEYYEYDEHGNKSRVETWYNGEISSVTTYEYTAFPAKDAK